MNWKLVRENGTELPPKIGDHVETFRGEPVEFCGATPPHKEGSSGRVCVKHSDGQRVEYFPSVVGLKWVLDASAK